MRELIMRFEKKYVSLFAMLLFSFSSFAGVNLKNGNFYIAYADLEVRGAGEKLEILRNYNSKSTEVGWFGFGWGSKFETNLSESADGCVVVKEYGGGAQTRFCPNTKLNVTAAIDKIIDAMRKKSTLNEASVKSLRKRLKNNAEQRHSYALQFGVKAKIAEGTKLFSNQRGIQELLKTKDGYKRTTSSSEVEYFNNKGQMTKYKSGPDYSLEFVYKNGKLDSIKDSKAKQIYFKWYSNGRIKHVWSSGDKKVEYRYEGKKLVYTKDIEGNEYGYDYDKSYNLTEIIYNPNRKKGVAQDSMKMTYDPKTMFVTSVTDRNGTKTEYHYDSNPQKPEDHYWTEVKKKGFNGKFITDKYEYEIKTRADGSRFTYKINTCINSVCTTVIKNECCENPVKIIRGNQVTNFEYNDDGLLTKKTSTSGEYVEIEYHKEHKKISKVVNRDGWTKFLYDKKGNLTNAENKAGNKVLLLYENGKITSMADTQKGSNKVRKLSFKYNSLGKPGIISMNGVGAIKVRYDNYGSIKKVEYVNDKKNGKDSSSGHKMALQVTEAFQNLLAIVKPAGVNLNM